jgi:hypothetical protein
MFNAADPDPLLPGATGHEITKILAIDRARHAFGRFVFGVFFGLLAVTLGLRAGAAWPVLWACGTIGTLFVEFLIYRFLRECVL